MGKVYLGFRKPDGTAYVMVRDAQAQRGPVPLQHVIRHSPTGLEWGYGGSGPADLALSILADYFGEAADLPAAVFAGYTSKGQDAIERTKAWKIYQDFKSAVIAGLPGRPEAYQAYMDPEIADFGLGVLCWTLTEEQVRQAVMRILSEGGRCLLCLSRLHNGDCINYLCPQSALYGAGAGEQP